MVVLTEGQYEAGYHRLELTPGWYSKTPSLVLMNMSIFKDTHIQVWAPDLSWAITRVMGCREFHP